MSQHAPMAAWVSLDAAMRAAAAVTAAARAGALDPQLHAFVSLARELPHAGRGKLAGMPYAAKDLFATCERAPTCGLDHGIDLGVAGDADVLRRLDGAGAVRIGFTTMTALAYEPSGHNVHQRPAKNPWNIDFIPGGSSSGSAVAVASGMAAIALGSDTGGSVRIPAQACGVTGWKSSYGAVPVGGAMALAPTLDTIGLLARSAADLAVAAPVIAQGLPEAAPVSRAAVMADVLREAEAAVRLACEGGIAAIEAAGVMLTRRDAMAAIKAVDAVALLVLQGEAARMHRARIDDAQIDAVLRKRLAKGLTIDDATLAASAAKRTALSAPFLERIFGEADVVLLPVMPVRTPLCSTCDPASAAFDARALYRLSEWTRFVNLLGFPALALPVGLDDRGMPVALQIVGRPNSDLALIALAETVQKQIGWAGGAPAGLADR